MSRQYPSKNSRSLSKLGIVAGNGPLPVLARDSALRQGREIAIAAIREEADPELEPSGEEPAISVQWIGLGQLGKLFKFFRSQRVGQAILVGQVKHDTIFSRETGLGLSALPDWRMLRLLAALPKKNTESLIGAVVEALEAQGIEVLDSRTFLEVLLPRRGVLTERQPTPDELRNIEVGRQVAQALTQLDVGQTVVIRDQAVVALEAMEGTDTTIRRASKLARGKPLTVVKVSRPNREMRFDVPVVGLGTLRTCLDCNVSVLSIDAGKTLVLDLEAFLKEAQKAEMTVVAQ